MVNDPIGDMLAQIKNAALAKKETVDIPFSKIKMAVARTLLAEGYLSSVDKAGTDPKLRLKLKLAYKDSIPVITDLKRKSKPGLRVYVAKNNIRNVVGGMGVAVISTSKGVMSGKEARKLGLGGELLCEVWKK